MIGQLDSKKMEKAKCIWICMENFQGGEKNDSAGGDLSLLGDYNEDYGGCSSFLFSLIVSFMYYIDVSLSCLGFLRHRVFIGTGL